MIITLPIPGFVSVVSLAVLRLPCNKVQFTLGLPPGLIGFALFLLFHPLPADEAVQIIHKEHHK